MLRIVAIEREPETGTAGDSAEDSVRLDHDQRNRRRMVFETEGGASILLDLQRPAHLRDGDAFRLEDGSRVRVDAVSEALLEIGAPSTATLVRIAWHLGNRHLPTQCVRGMRGGTLRIRHDHVIADMIVGLGGTCAHILAPFDPEGGAYAGGHQVHGHDDDHDHDHDHHDHSRGRGHRHDHG